MMRRGFSLIEAVLYLSLFSILMTGGLAGVYAITTTVERTRAQARIEQEGAFLLERLRWSLQQNKSVPDLFALSAYTMKGQVLVHAGTPGDPNDPERILISFVLSTLANGVTIERSFRDTFYPTAP